MPEKLIAFGDVHLNWQAARVILDHARKEEVNKALTLGDEGYKIYPFGTGEQEEYDKLYHEIRTFRNEKPKRILICIKGDKTVTVPPDLFVNFVGFDDQGKNIGSVIFHEDNIIAGHSGKWILEEHEELIKDYQGYEPLIVFHGHSHSMGVLPTYKWLQDDEKVHWLPNSEEVYNLEPRNVYWVNPGGNFMRGPDGTHYANFSIYDPEQQIVTLRTIVFDQNKISPSK